MQMLIQQKHVTGNRGTFCDLMDLYERNYIGLRRLMPDVGNMGARAVSAVPGCLDLHYRLMERTRYTTTFILTYHLDQNSRAVSEPNLEIRLYHDAQLAEVLSAMLHRHHYKNDAVVSVDQLITPDQSILQSKWMLNRFLYKWLSFCLNRGHLFRPGADWESFIKPPHVRRA